MNEPQILPETFCSVGITDHTILASIMKIFVLHNYRWGEEDTVARRRGQ